MTKEKVNRLLLAIDNVQVAMIKEGYNRLQLNTMICNINSMPFDTYKEYFNFICDKFLKINEKAEYYNVCSQIVAIKKQTNRTRKTK